MGKTDELRDMLENLKKEIPISSNFDFAGNIPSRNKWTEMKKDITYQDIKKEIPSSTKPDNSRFNIIWSENKETLLFGMLVSLILVSIGTLSAREYIILTGTISFMLFSMLSFLAFFRYILVASKRDGSSAEILAKIDFLEKKIEYLSKGATNSDDRKYVELEDKIEELKVIVKTLSQK